MSEGGLDFLLPLGVVHIQFQGCESFKEQTQKMKTTDQAGDQGAHHNTSAVAGSSSVGTII